MPHREPIVNDLDESIRATVPGPPCTVQYKGVFCGLIALHVRARLNIGEYAMTSASFRKIDLFIPLSRRPRSQLNSKVFGGIHGAHPPRVGDELRHACRVERCQAQHD